MRNHIGGRAAAAAVVICIAVACGGRAPSPPPPEPTPMEREVYQIGVTDLLRISVWSLRPFGESVLLRP